MCEPRIALRWKSFMCVMDRHWTDSLNRTMCILSSDCCDKRWAQGLCLPPLRRNIVNVRQFFFPSPQRHLKGLLTIAAATVCVDVQPQFCYLYLVRQLTFKTGLRIQPVLQYTYAFCQVLWWGLNVLYRPGQHIE